MPSRALVVLLAGLACCGPAPTTGGFDGERAFGDLVALVRIGPRPAGSPGARAARELIRERLRQAGWPVEDHAFEVRGPDGTRVEMANLIATRRGERPGIIVLGTHYDTKHLPGIRFVGANDGASGCAVLLELARVLGSRPRAFAVQLVFFDGEEAFGPSITPADGLYGSTALAERMQRDGSLAEIRALLLLDMVADRDLNLAVDLGAPAHLRRILERAAEGLGEAGQGLVDPSAALDLVDDHSPFVRRGVADALVLIDFQFGARETPGPYWHTARDDLDAVSAQSLNRVGRLAVQLLERLERRLLERERAPERAPEQAGR